MDTVDVVAKRIAYLAGDRPIKYVTRAVAMINTHRTVNPDPRRIREQLLKTYHESSPFTSIRFIEAAVRNLAQLS